MRVIRTKRARVRTGAAVAGVVAIAVAAPSAWSAVAGSAPSGSAAPVAHAAGGVAHLSLDGVGQAKFGRTFTQIRRAIGADLICTSGNPCVCATVRRRTNVTFVFGGDRRLKLVVGEPAKKGATVVTGRGLRLGDSEAKMKRLYPKSKVAASGPRYRWTRGFRGYIFDFTGGTLSQVVAGYKSYLLTEEFCA